MQETPKNELFSDIPTEESATINGGHGYGRGRYVSYRGYRGGYGYRSVSYGYRGRGYGYRRSSYGYRGGCY